MKKLLIVFLLLGSLLLPHQVFAQEDPHGTCGNDAINTALGCLNIKGPKTISTLLTWGISVGGGIAFLMIIYSGFQIASAQGDAKRVKAAQELLTSALAGLFLIAVSVILLNFLGVNVLGLQSFGFSNF